MTLIQFFRLVSRYLNLMFLTAAVAGITVFFLTRNAKKEYSTSAIINTGLVTGYTIESSQGGRIDYGFANNEMENILGMARSRETMRELAVTLLAKALILKEPDAQILSPESFEELKKSLPEYQRQGITVPDDYETTRTNILAELHKTTENPIKKLLESKHNLFGLEHLQTITIRREGNSDMIRLAYTTTDAAVCRNTLALLAELVINKYRLTKEGQSADVLAFFENATRESAQALAQKEDDMLTFMSGNKIINYYEQTRFIAAKKEDLDEQYFRELMTLAAADSSRRNLERKLEARVNLPEINRRLIDQREQLASVHGRLAALELGSFTDSLQNPLDISEKNRLTQFSNNLEKDLRKQAEALFAVNRTPEGVETQTLLNRWLEQWLAVEQTLARLEVLRDRNAEFDRIYSRFAPWGSKIKRLEREIEVSEKSYLENLHSFNQARLHKFNTVMSRNLRVMDPPIMPDKALPSKRLMSVILAAMAGFILVLGGAIAFELLDNTLHDPQRAADTTGLSLVTAFPTLPRNWQNSKTFDYNFLVQRATGQLLQHIKLSLREKNVIGRPARILWFSSRKGEGKSMLAGLIVDTLRSIGHSVLFLRALDTQTDKPDHPDDRFFTVGQDFFDKQNEGQLLNSPYEDYSAYHYIVTEIPAIMANTYPADYVCLADLVYFAARANRTWNPADTRSLENLKLVVNQTCYLLLNLVRPDDLENALGEVPKRRSALRIWLKRRLQK